MLKKNKVIKLESQEEKDFWLVGNSSKKKSANSGKIVVSKQKPTIGVQKGKKRKPLLRGLFYKFKLPKKTVKTEKIGVKSTKIEKKSKKSALDINIDTVFDKIYRELESGKAVSITELSLKLNLSKEKVLDLAMIFEESGKVDIDYPILGSPKLVLKKEKGEME